MPIAPEGYEIARVDVVVRLRKKGRLNLQYSANRQSEQYDSPASAGRICVSLTS